MIDEWGKKIKFGGAERGFQPENEITAIIPLFSAKKPSQAEIDAMVQLFLGKSFESAESAENNFTYAVISVQRGKTRKITALLH